jgi:hypothetical protein
MLAASGSNPLGAFGREVRRSQQEATMIKLLAVLVLIGSRVAVAQVDLPWDEALVKAQVEGKYRMLLKQITVPEDAATEGEFKDFGSWFGTSWAGYADLPQGYWVYVYPCWYVWGELSATPIQKRPWGPEQATGEPDSKGAAPESAWVPASRDRPEWLLVEFESQLRITEVIIHETQLGCPVQYKITALCPVEVECAMTGAGRPSPASGAVSVVRRSFKPQAAVQRLRIDVSSGYQCWKGIDAVGVVDEAGTVHWARSAHASSWRGQEPAAGPIIFIPPVTSPEEEIAALKAEIAALKAEIESLKKQLAEKK